MIAAIRKASKQPDEAIQLLGLEESPLALIDRQAATLERLEGERASHLARIEELGQLMARMQQEHGNWLSVAPKIQFLVGQYALRTKLGGLATHDAGDQHRLSKLPDKLEAMLCHGQSMADKLHLLWQKATAARSAHYNLKQNMERMLGAIQSVAEGPIVRLRRLLKNWWI
jgi:hypothetical protein